MNELDDSLGQVIITEIDSYEWVHYSIENDSIIIAKFKETVAMYLTEKYILLGEL